MGIMAPCSVVNKAEFTAYWPQAMAKRDILQRIPGHFIASGIVSFLPSSPAPLILLLSFHERTLSPKSPSKSQRKRSDEVKASSGAEPPLNNLLVLDGCRRDAWGVEVLLCFCSDLEN